MEVIIDYRCLASVLLTCLATLCLPQQVTVRIINAANGRPLAKQAVSVSFLYDGNYDKEVPEKRPATANLKTDSNGEAHFELPEPVPVHFSAQARLDWSRWKCGCGILGSTDDLLRKGVGGGQRQQPTLRNQLFSNRLQERFFLLLAHYRFLSGFFTRL
jgi:hypothetical protein